MPPTLCPEDGNILFPKIFCSLEYQMMDKVHNSSKPECTAIVGIIFRGKENSFIQQYNIETVFHV
jgi:hypothetical protein